MDVFRNFTSALQSESHPTSSLLYIGIHSLINNIEANELSATISSNLVARVKERFQDVLQSGEENSDPFYLAAAYLDPQTALCSLLRGKEGKAKWCIKKLAEHLDLCEVNGDDADSSTPPASQSEIRISQLQATSYHRAAPTSQLLGFNVEDELPNSAPILMELDNQINRFLIYRKKPAFYQTTANSFWKCHHRVNFFSFAP